MGLREIARNASRAQLEARHILATLETSADRTITIEETFDRLGPLALRQDDLIRQALRAIENELYRAAIVLAWAAFMDFLEEKLAKDKFRVLNLAYPDWGIKDIDDLRDKRPDYQIVEALRKVGLTNKNEMKSVLGLLSIRNEAGHPSHFLPGLNQALGFVTEIIERIAQLKTRRLKRP